MVPAKKKKSNKKQRNKKQETSSIMSCMIYARLENKHIKRVLISSSLSYKYSGKRGISQISQKSSRVWYCEVVWLPVFIEKNKRVFWAYVKFVIIIHHSSRLSVRPSNNQFNFFPQNWRQPERRLTMSSNNGAAAHQHQWAQADCGFMRLRAFFIPFIWLRFLPLECLGLMKKHEILRPPYKQRANDTSIFISIHLLKSFCQLQNILGVRKHFIFFNNVRNNNAS